jgi:acetyltransferase-like isoleucine patch superfamily enzyme
VRSPLEQLSLARDVLRREIWAQRAYRRLERRGLDVGPPLYIRETDLTRFTFGAGCTVQHGTLLMMEDAEMTFGERVTVGEYCNLRPSASFIRIGSRTLLAQYVSLIAADHAIEDGVPQLGADLRDGYHGITIGEDCWLGTQSVVLPGVTLGDRCIVGAGAVVTRSFPAGTRLGGVPAKPLG